MMTWRTRVGAAMLGAVAPPLLALGGCSLGASSDATPTQARSDLQEVLTATQRAVGGEWEVRDDPTPRGCVIPLWVEGERYPALRIGSAPLDAEVALAAVERTWTQWGYEVDSTVLGEVTQLQGQSPVDAVLIFRVSPDAMTLQGESECRPAA